jgi:hypothetical protein
MEKLKKYGSLAAMIDSLDELRKWFKNPLFCCHPRPELLDSS